MSTDPETVLVTGAAGAIGSATVRRFLDAGFCVIGFDRAPPPQPEPNRYTQVDLVDEEQVADAIGSWEPRSPLHHVVGIAGGALPGEPETKDDLDGVSPALFRASLEANLTSQFLLLRAVLPWLRRSPGTSRSVTLTSSFNALTGQGMPAYSAAKAGLIGMMRSLVDPLGSEGIRINVVAPGTIRTPRTERLWGDHPDHFERLERSTALRRLGRPDDVATAFVSLTRLEHVTGQVVVVDGGQTVIHR